MLVLGIKPYSKIPRSIMFTVAFFTFLLLSSATLFAKPYQLTVGAGGGAAPPAPGIEKYNLQPVPYISVIYKKRLQLGVEGLVWNIIQPSKHFPVQGTLCFLPHAGRRTDKLPERYQCLEDVKVTLDAGAKIALPVGPGILLETLVLTDMLDRGHNGMHGEVRLRWKTKIESIRLGIELMLAGQAANRSYLKSFYGVDDTTALNSTFDQYSPDHGWEKIRCGLLIKKELFENWNLLSQIEFTSLQGQALRSPLVETQNQLQLKVLTAYTF